MYFTVVEFEFPALFPCMAFLFSKLLFDQIKLKFLVFRHFPVEKLDFPVEQLDFPVEQLDFPVELGMPCMKKCGKFKLTNCQVHILIFLANSTLKWWIFDNLFTRHFLQ